MHAVWAAVAALIFLGTASAQQRAIDMRLVDAGFKMRAAITAQQTEHMRKMPARRFVPQMSNDRRYYIYVDPDDCKCAFVGDDRALQAYRDMSTRAAQPDAARGPGGGHSTLEVVIHDMNEDFSQLDLFRHPF